MVYEKDDHPWSIRDYRSNELLIVLNAHLVAHLVTNHDNSQVQGRLAVVFSLGNALLQ